MECPACHKAMEQEDFGDALVDVCKEGCGGIWFDWSELQLLDEKHEGLGQSLQGALNSPRHKDNARGRINCPKCHVPMVAHFYKSETMVTIDECYSCGGFFLDAGELEVLRENHLDDAQREQIVETLLAHNPGFTKAELELDKTKAQIALAESKRPDAVAKVAEMLTHHFGK